MKHQCQFWDSTLAQNLPDLYSMDIWKHQVISLGKQGRFPLLIAADLEIYRFFSQIHASDACPARQWWFVHTFLHLVDFEMLFGELHCC